MASAPVLEKAKIVVVAAGLFLLAGAMSIAEYWSSGCSVDLDLALGQSRSSILQQSSEGPTERCTAYRAHMELLESKKSCIRPRQSASLSSELAAYGELIARTCMPAP
jgi:hypothetical protein